MREVIEYYSIHHHFMGSVLVAARDQVLLDAGFGLANLEWEIPNSPATKFRIACLTMQFTAAAILLLKEEGRIDLHAPIATYLPEAPAHWNPVTIIHLLTHTSGIPCYTQFSGYAAFRTQPTTPADLFLRCREEPLLFAPGEQCHSSHSDYVLLGHILEILVHRHYIDWIRRMILRPLEMHDTGYDSNSAILPQRASGYVMGAKRPVNAAYIHMSVPFAAGGLYSTTGDILRWLRGLFGGRVLSTASLALMTTPFRENVGLGCAVRTVGERRSVEQGGGIEGFNSFLSFYPDSEVAVIVLANFRGSPVGEIALKLASLAHREPVMLISERREIPLSAELTKQYVGSYVLTSDGTPLKIIAKDGKLVIELKGGTTFPMFAETATEFFLKAFDAQIEFQPGGVGPSPSLVLRRGQSALIGNRVTEVIGFNAGLGGAACTDE